MNDPIGDAAHAIARGEVVAAASESFFALLVDALSGAAALRLFALKGREADQPVPVLLPSALCVAEVAEDVPARAIGLMAAYWPGPLTIVLRARPNVPALICGGTGKIGVRVPGPCPAAELLRRFGRPLTATSANRAHEPPMTRAQDVRKAFGSAVAVVLPGDAPGGLPSTVVDATVEPPRLLRAGAVAITEGA